MIDSHSYFTSFLPGPFCRTRLYLYEVHPKFDTNIIRMLDLQVNREHVLNGNPLKAAHI